MYVEIQIQRYSQRQADFPYRPACDRGCGAFADHLWSACADVCNGGDQMKENQNNRHDKEPAADSASVDVTEPAKSRYISETEWILLCIEIGMGLPTLVFFFAVVLRFVLHA